MNLSVTFFSIASLLFITTNLYADESKNLYNTYCMPCHGITGNGQGPGTPWLSPKPRSFITADYKWRTTKNNQMPSDEDLATTIAYGILGTSMHPFAPSLSKKDIEKLVTTIKNFAPKKFQHKRTKISFSKKPSVTPEKIKRGQRLWKELGCVSCHGNEGKGDGLALSGTQQANRPYDLTMTPLRRPTNHNDGITSIYTTLITGIHGTTMPSYVQVASDSLWNVAMFVDSIRYPYSTPPKAISPNIPTTAQTDVYSSHPLFGKIISKQDTTLTQLTPAQQSLSAKQCARCHAKQYREWKSSLHALASSPGYLAQFDETSKPSSVEACSVCHAPLTEQQTYRRSKNATPYERNSTYDESLHHQGVTCSACHIRQGKRLGPPNTATSLLKQHGYPKQERSIYERSDFCLPCHQLSPNNALNNKPLLNTYIEWLQGPYMPRGIQCQHCHMSNREHQWLGIHDKETLLQGITLNTSLSIQNNELVAQATLANTGAAHYLPTTPTPALWMSLELLNSDKDPIDDTYHEQRIGRHIKFNHGKWTEIEDTRIPPGQSIHLIRRWKSDSVEDTSYAKIQIRVAPDDYYEYFYMSRLRQQNLSDDTREQYEQALQNAQQSHYRALTKIIPIRPHVASSSDRYKRNKKVKKN